MIPIFSLVAYSGTGKTTFMEKLIPELKKRGFRLAVIKHDGHDFEIDQEGKDSYRITKAGADITGLISKTKAFLLENRNVDVQKIIDKLQDIDLVLTEGYKTGSWPKIMLHRQATGKDLPLNPKDCLAVVSDVPVKGARNFFQLEDAAGLAEFIVKEMEAKKKGDNPLLKVPFLSKVKSETLEGLWQEGRLIDVAKKKVLLEVRQKKQEVCIQISGKSMVYSLTHDGLRKVIFIFGEGILLNDHVYNDHFPSLYCETMEKSQIFMISKSKFIKWMEKDASLMKAVVTMQEWKMWRMGHQLKNANGSIYMERKLAAKLWKLGRDFGKKTPEGIEIDLNLSITFLSDMMGAPRETTSRLCKTLVDYGLIQINKKRITILDAEQLAQLYRKGKVTK